MLIGQIARISILEALGDSDLLPKERCKDTVLAHNMNCYVEPQKKPIDLFSDAELLQEIQKRLNRYWNRG